MKTGEIITLIILLVASVGGFVISAFQFREKGFLFNNAYLYASKQERETMNKKPHYRQSAIVFLLIGIVFLLNAIYMINHVRWLFYASMVLLVVLIVYAIISSIRIEVKGRK